MEQWKEAYVGIIPHDDYHIKIENGDRNGLVVMLESDNHTVIMNFGIILGIRMLDEGIILGDLYSSGAFEKFRTEGFKNVIYQVQGGEFERQINEITNGNMEVIYNNYKHYVIITMNYCIDIIAEYEPEIKTL